MSTGEPEFEADLDSTTPETPSLEDADVGFDLLRDFWAVLPGLAIDGLDVARLDRAYIDKAVREPMLRAFEIAEYRVYPWEFEWLRERAKQAIEPGEMCVTLDRGEYFTNADYQLDLTRTVSDLTRTGSQHLRRLPRDRRNSLKKQLSDVRGIYIKRRSSPIVLTDDGVSTGQMLSMVLEECASRDIPISRIVVCCSNSYIEPLHPTDIESLIPKSPGRPWLNERDLYWGLPRSGLSFIPESVLNWRSSVYGVPFTSDVRLVRQRIGIEDGAEEFRVANLAANSTLWSHFERVADRKLYCEDCPPLRFVGDVMKRPQTRVLDLIGELSSTSEPFLGRI